ncbi:hypothetical protein NIES2109_00930 [Nostoc sp. HK-01]|nr:hypothetical protein NIES2109_00930 [Nostoc sp. HK-01]
MLNCVVRRTPLLICLTHTADFRSKTALISGFHSEIVYSTHLKSAVMSKTKLGWANYTHPTHVEILISIAGHTSVDSTNLIYLDNLINMLS